MNQTPLSLYQSRINSGFIQNDPVQETAVQVLDELFRDIVEDHNRDKGLLQWVRNFGQAHKHDLKGVYLHGDVGRGKSMLMDLFYECLPSAISKRRVHFHAFMIEVHDYFHSRREDDDFSMDVDGLIPPLSSLISARSNILCFDEFHVVDVADAMILGRLFTALIDRGVIIVSTSNWVPDSLYEGGLQRERFLPFIELLKNRLHVVHLDNDIDYRKQFLSEQGTYFHPLGSEATTKANQLFIKLTQGATPHSRILKVKGRNIIANSCVENIARFTFAQLCENPHGAEDYIAIASNFNTIFLDNVPKLTYDRRNEAKRLMTLIDVLYEAGTNLVITAAAPADQLYLGDDHKKEFERTVSRLHEMQNR